MDAKNLSDVQILGHVVEVFRQLHEQEKAFEKEEVDLAIKAGMIAVFRLSRLQMKIKDEYLVRINEAEINLSSGGCDAEGNTVELQGERQAVEFAKAIRNKVKAKDPNAVVELGHIEGFFSKIEIPAGSSAYDNSQMDFENAKPGETTADALERIKRDQKFNWRNRN